MSMKDLFFRVYANGDKSRIIDDQEWKVFETSNPSICELKFRHLPSKSSETPGEWQSAGFYRIA